MSPVEPLLLRKRELNWPVILKFTGWLLLMILVYWLFHLPEERLNAATPKDKHSLRDAFTYRLIGIGLIASVVYFGALRALRSQASVKTLYGFILIVLGIGLIFLFKDSLQELSLGTIGLKLSQATEDAERISIISQEVTDMSLSVSNDYRQLTNKIFEIEGKSDALQTSVSDIADKVKELQANLEYTAPYMDAVSGNRKGYETLLRWTREQISRYYTVARHDVSHVRAVYAPISRINSIGSFLRRTHKTVDTADVNGLIAIFDTIKGNKGDDFEPLLVEYVSKNRTDLSVKDRLTFYVYVMENANRLHELFWAVDCFYAESGMPVDSHGKEHDRAVLWWTRNKDRF